MRVARWALWAIAVALIATGSTYLVALATWVVSTLLRPNVALVVLSPGALPIWLTHAAICCLAIAAGVLLAVRLRRLS